jgi:hypothetical protein
MDKIEKQNPIITYKTNLGTLELGQNLFIIIIKVIFIFNLNMKLGKMMNIDFEGGLQPLALT